MRTTYRASGKGDLLFLGEGKSWLEPGSLEKVDLVFVDPQGADHRYDTTSLGDSKDLIITLDNDDKIYAGAGNDFLYGGEGDDTLRPGSGNDIVHGGDLKFTTGPDKFLADGEDTADYSTGDDGQAAAANPITVFIGDSSKTDQGQGRKTTDGWFSVDDGEGGLDHLISIENLIGTDHDDKVIIKDLKDIPIQKLTIDAGEQTSKDGDELDFSPLNEGIKFENNKIKGYDGLEFKDFETIKGTAYDDTLLYQQTQPDNSPVTLIGGEGRDWIWNRSPGGVIYGDTFSGVSATPGEDGNPAKVADDPANADNFWWWPNTTIKDPQRLDVLQFWGFPLTGGTQSIPLAAGGGGAALFTPSATLFAGDAFNNENGHFFFDNFLVSMNYVYKDNTLHVVNALDGLMGLFSDVSFEQTSDGTNIRGAQKIENFAIEYSAWGFGLLNAAEQGTRR